MADLTQIVVPIELRALLVNQPVINGTTFRRWTNHYEYLVQNMQSPMPGPFQVGGQDAKPGIHLHWRLPKALTHGQQQALLFGVYQGVQAIVSGLQQNAIAPGLSSAFTANGLPQPGKSVSVGPATNGDTSNWLIIDWPNARKYLVGIKLDGRGGEYLSVADATLAFPEVPNRWLVTRFQPGMTKVDAKSWIIESDVINAAGSVASYLDPKSQNLSSSGVVCKIGNAEVLTASWSDAGTGKDMFLRAIGPGDVTFSAYAPAVENVFSFVDTDAAQLPENTLLTYVIAGWYANADFDPLNNPLPQVAAQEFLALMKSLHWDIAGVDDIDKYTGPIAKQSVYHGMVHSLVWQTKTMPAGQDTEIPQDVANTVKVAIGNTSVEALTALIGATSGDPSIDLTLLEALQYGVLDAIDQVGGRTLVADKMRQARYGTKSGGLSWEIVASEQQGGALSGTAPPDLTAYAAGLATLNQQQQALDEKRRELTSLQWTLYARWWKNQNYNVLGLGPTYPPDNMDAIAAALQDQSDLTASIQQLQQEISTAYSSGHVPYPSSATSIASYAATTLQLPGSLILKAANAPRYWQPRDPVLLVSGVTSAVYDTSMQLQCRTADQLVTGLKINNITVTAAGEASFIPLPVANANIPGLVAALCQEAYFLDPGNAENIAKNLFKGNVQQADVIKAVAAGGWADTASFGPAPVAVTRWKQPWMPLFLEWSIKWFPTCAQKDQNSPWTFNRDEWKFDGDDYDWSGTSLNESLLVGYSGRTVLSSHAIITFESRLRDFIKKSKQPRPDLEKLDALVNAMQSWGILSQSLSGLHQQFVTRSIGQSWPPIGDVAALIQDQYAVSPDPTKGDKDLDYGPVPPTFFPQMGGFFVIDDIGIIDAFGQSISLMPANNNPTGGTSSAFTPIRSQQVTPANPNIAVGDYTPAQFIKQAFGLVQPAQMEMRWVDAVKDDAEVGLAAGANPVCGWLLPNHLDQSISFYDQGGKLLGELRASSGTDGSTWYPAPDSQTPITDPANIPNAHLSKMVTGLMAAQRASSVTLDNFMKVIDETLWLVDPLGGRSDSDMSVLIGRPLAVLRLKLSLDLEGPAYSNQSWADTLIADDNGVTSTAFALRLGSPAVREDGVIGYFADEKYQTFNSVYYPAGLDQASSYVQEIGGQAANYLSVVPEAADKFVTLLMDPRGSVHGSTGILPVKEISLPSRFVDPVLKNMEVTFRVGSLLTSLQAVLIPRLSEQHGQWSWIDHSSPTEFQIEPIQFASSNAKLSTPAMMIRDGWLKFVSDLEGGN
jgi:hypothetical protein